MKKALFTLTAVLAAGLAGAITYDWTSATSVVTATPSSASQGAITTLGSDYQSAVNVNVGTTNLYGAVVTATGLPGSATAVRVIFGLSDGTRDQALSVSISGAGALSIYANGSGSTDIGAQTGTLVATSSTTFESTSFTNGYYLVLSVTRSQDGTTSVALYGSATQDGELTTLIADTTVSGINADTVLDYVYAGDQRYINSEGSEAGGAAIYGPSSSIVVSATETVLLPEPTVLALLALGVAGLALKRKVA